MPKVATSIFSGNEYKTKAVPQILFIFASTFRRRIITDGARTVSTTKYYIQTAHAPSLHNTI